MNIIIEIVILFFLLFFYFSVLNSKDSNNWPRALILGIALPVLGLLPHYMGVIGWVIAFIVALILISKSMGQSFSGSLLFLMIIGLVQYIIQLGVYNLAAFS